MKLYKTKDVITYVRGWGVHPYVVDGLCLRLGISDKESEDLLPARAQVNLLLSIWFFTGDADDEQDFNGLKALDRKFAWDKLSPYISDYGSLLEKEAESNKVTIGKISIVDGEFYGVSGMPYYFSVRTGLPVDIADLKPATKFKIISYNLYAKYYDLEKLLDEDAQMYADLAKRKKEREEREAARGPNFEKFAKMAGAIAQANNLDPGDLPCPSTSTTHETPSSAS